jgi:nucleoside-diphosphate-sugar epimerase
MKNSFNKSLFDFGKWGLLLCRFAYDTIAECSLGGNGMKKVIVIGAFNFIGYALCSRLIEEDVLVYALDVPRSEIDQSMIEEKQFWIGRNAKISFQQIKDFTFSAIIQDHCDYVIYTLYDPLEKCYQPNLDHCIEQTRKLLESVITYCSNTNCQLVLLSTYEVEVPQNELISNRPTIPSTENGRLHLYEEEFIQKEGLKRSIRYFIVRVPTVYGPRQPDYMFFQKAILSRLENKTMDFTILEDTRDLLYIDDVADWLCQLMTSPLKNEIIHLTSGLPNLWLEGAKLLCPNVNLPLPLQSSRSDGKVEKCVEKITPLHAGIQKQIEFTKKRKKWNI